MKIRMLSQKTQATFRLPTGAATLPSPTESAQKTKVGIGGVVAVREFFRKLLMEIGK